MFAVALLNRKGFQFLMASIDFTGRTMMPVIITIVRLSFLKLKNLNFPNKLVHKEFYLKNQKKISQFLVYIIEKQLLQLMKITEREKRYHFTSNT